MTAKLLRYRELSAKVLERLQRIMRGPSYWGFDPADIESPSVRVAVTTKEDGLPGPFCPVEHVMLIRAAGVPEGTTTPEAHEAGALIDAEIVTAAQREGITKLLMVLPPGMTPPKGYQQVSHGMSFFGGLVVRQTGHAKPTRWSSGSMAISINLIPMNGAITPPRP